MFYLYFIDHVVGLHNRNIMEGGASLAGVDQELGHGVDRNVANPRNRPHRRALAEHGEDLGAGREGELVHVQTMKSSV